MEIKDYEVDFERVLSLSVTMLLWIATIFCLFTGELGDAVAFAVINIAWKMK